MVVSMALPEKTSVVTAGMESLTAAERSELAHLETTIVRGAGQVAVALATVRDRRLYREEHPTFEAYCRDRWGMSRSRAYQTIHAGEVNSILSTVVDSAIPEAQARELVDLRDDPAALRTTYQRVHAETDGNVTAAAIRDFRRMGEPHPPTSEAGQGCGPDPHPSQSLPGDRPGAWSSSGPSKSNVIDLDPGQTRAGRPAGSPVKRRRRPITDAFGDGIYEVRRRVESLHRLTKDDRWTRNVEQLAEARNYNELILVIDLLQKVVDHLPADRYDRAQREAALRHAAGGGADAVG